MPYFNHTNWCHKTYVHCTFEYNEWIILWMLRCCCSFFLFFFVSLFLCARNPFFPSILFICYKMLAAYLWCGKLTIFFGWPPRLDEREICSHTHRFSLFTFNHVNCRTMNKWMKIKQTNQPTNKRCKIHTNLNRNRNQNQPKHSQHISKLIWFHIILSLHRACVCVCVCVVLAACNRQRIETSAQCVWKRQI